ncbi:unnamed protein product [Caenorhabditis nigoni]
MIVSDVAAEVVLQYMDTNFRLRFSARNPAFREIEKSYPLHIKNLSLRSVGFKVDGTIYRLGIYRKYKAGEPVHLMAIDYNRKGGVQYDTKIFERYGDNEPEKIYKGSLERDLRELETAKKRLEELRKVKNANAELENEKENLEELKCEEFIVLKMSRKERMGLLKVKYTKPLQEVFKDLMDRIFGGRGHHLHVGHLEVLCGFENPLKTVKMQVKNLAVGCSVKMSTVNDLFFTDSPPLETATSHIYTHQDHRLLANSKLLIIEVGKFNSVSEFDRRTFSNRRILFKCTDSYQSALVIALYFKKENPAMKSHFSFEVPAKTHQWYKIVMKLANEVTKKDFMEKRFALPATFTIKTDAGADLKLSANKKDDSIVTIDLELIP